MKRMAWGIVVGGAVAAAFTGSAMANATGETWTPDYTVDNAKLFLGSDQTSAAWELPASFTSSTGTTLTGTDYLTTSPGGFNDEFVTKSGAIYDQNQLGGGFTNLYYGAGTGHDAVDMMKTPFGTFNLSSMASWFAPQDFEATHSPAAPIGDNNIGAALGLLSGGKWVGGADNDAMAPLQAADSSALVWSAPATFVNTGADVPALTGTAYVLAPNDVEFVDKAGDVFGERVLGPLFDNLYYDPAGGPAKDFLQTPLGLVNISSLASWFAPADVSDLTAASPLGDLTDAGLYSALDLGLPDVTP